MVPSESATCKWCMVCITNSLNKQDGFRSETRYALMEKNWVLFYLIIVFREGSQTWFELLTAQWNLLAFHWDVGCIPQSACLWHPKKDISNAWIVDRLSWASTIRVLETFGRFPRKQPWSFLYNRVWNFTKRRTLPPVFFTLEIFENGWVLTDWDVYFWRISISHHNKSFSCYLL